MCLRLEYRGDERWTSCRIWGRDQAVLGWELLATDGGAGDILEVVIVLLIRISWCQYLAADIPVHRVLRVRWWH